MAEPIAQPRPRAVGSGRHARMITHSSSHPVGPYKKVCRYEAVRAMKLAWMQPVDCPVCLNVIFVMPRPKRLVWKTREMPRLPHVSTPDIDNLAKAVMDAWNGVLWRDDALVSEFRGVKVIAAGDEQPHVEAVLWARTE